MTKYLHSGLNNLDAQSSGTQSITATRGYDAFGNVESSSGSWTGAFGYGGPYGYQSAGEGGLMLLGHRYYDPSTGRFLTRDPIKDGRNWYGYGAGELAPTLFADPEGTRSLLFDGSALWVINDWGVPVACYPAASGVPGTGRGDQMKKDRGPIPEGKYWIAPGSGNYVVGFFDPRRLKQGYGWPRIGNSDSWGRVIIPLLPSPKTKIGGRNPGGFNIHGGKVRGSIGCIDVGPSDSDLYEAFVKGYPQPIPVFVDYGNWTGTTSGGDW